MQTFVYLISALLGGLTILGLIFHSLDRFIEDSDRAYVQKTVTDFWMRIAGLGTRDALRAALDFRYVAMKSLRFRFVRLFWILLLLMFAVTSYEILTADLDNVRSGFFGVISADFDVSTERFYHSHDTYFQTLNTYCIDNSDVWIHELGGYLKRRSDFDDFIGQIGANDPFELRMIGISTCALVIVILAIPLTISILISFRFTLWLLSKFISSSRSIIVIIVIYILLAVLVPQFLAAIMLLAMWAGIVGVFWGVVDLFYFNHPSVLTMIVGGAAVEIDIYSALFVLRPTLGVIKYASTQAMLWASLTFALDFTATMTVNFFRDAVKVINLDFSPTYMIGARNWAIFTDLAFSGIYFFPCLALVLAQRRPNARRVFLNFVQWIAEHRQGPVYALGEACTAFVKFLATLTRR